MNRPQKNKKNFAFIDNQNLNLGIQRLGWKMDWRKFRAFLLKEYGIKKAYMFIGYMPENEDLYNQMHEAGYLVVLKPTLEMYKTPAKEQPENSSAAEGAQNTAQPKNEPYKTYGEKAAETNNTPDPAQRPVKGNVDA